MKKWIDYRSDTVTQPTEAMRAAMAAAEVGDDVYGDDPTVNRLESMAADILGKEAALFVPSGTMGNQIGVMASTNRGGEVVLDAASHIMVNEVAGVAVLSSCQTRSVFFPDGIPDADIIKAAVRGKNIHYPTTQLICMENALSSGRVVPLDAMRSVYSYASSVGIPVHLDGARVFNAAIALGVDVKEITAQCDSVMACLSKGLCAPVGSMLAGDAEFVERARKCRKLLGGGMRQVGILAAAGILSITEMVPLLKNDHDNAKHLAAELTGIPGIFLNDANIDINMVFLRFELPRATMESLKAHLEEGGIRITLPGNVGDPLKNNVHRLRFVLNHDITKDDVDYTVERIRSFLAG